MNYERIDENTRINSASILSSASMSEKATRSFIEPLNDLKQLALLLWKNYSLQKRAVFSTILEILVPALFVFILLPIRTIVKSDNYLNDTVYPKYSVDDLPTSLQPSFVVKRSVEDVDDLDLRSGAWEFAYQPNSSQLVNRIMDKVGQQLELNIIPFENEKDMVKYLLDPVKLKYRLGGVSFHDTSLNNFTYAIRLSYSPRNSGQTGPFKRDMDWKTQFIYWLFPILGPREKISIEGGDPGYYREGFITIQKAIDYALIGDFNSSVDDVDLTLKRFPFPPYSDDKFVVVIQALFPFIIMLSFIFTVIITAKSIVYEKETGIKEAMKLMGMKPWIYWLSWYIKTFLLLLPSIVFMIVSFKIKMNLKYGGQASIVDKTDWLLFAVFLFLYASSSITFTFLCTTFFKKANSAAAGTGIIWFLTYLPYIFISLRYEKMSLLDKLLALLVNNLAMSEGVQLIGMFEGKGTGINWTNWTTGISVDDNFCMIMVMSFMVFNNFTHLVLTFYFEKVLPGDHGIGRPWHFPISDVLAYFARPNLELNVSFLSEHEKDSDMDRIRDVKRRNSDGQSIADGDSLPVYIEDEANYLNSNVGIKIKNISKNFKQFDKVKRAVNNLSLNIYEGQISVLLGHNGAGKSTTISMITGLTEPTSGQILINGIDVVQNTNDARRCIGFCPQYNLLFDDLTVYEHLKFFSQLKNNFDDKEINKMLEIIGLSDKKHALAKTLSGGMKRKLSVSIAFIGKSSIVILDEPSSGMDPQARHSTWSLLQNFKKERNCTILLTTHFMDEADFLGDRIAIMSRGALRCCGSSLYLKSKYSSGYNLILTKKQPENGTDVQQANETNNRLKTLVEKMIPDARLNENLNSEISFILPSEHTAKFGELFKSLEANKDYLNVNNIGISISTLEDVFLKIGNSEKFEDADEDQGPSVDFGTVPNGAFNQQNDGVYSINADVNSHAVNGHNDDGLWIGSKAADVLHGFRFVFQQFSALIKKRSIHSFRNKTLILVQLIVPVAVLLINLIYLKYAPIKPGNSPALLMDLGRYSTNYVPFKLNVAGNLTLPRSLADMYTVKIQQTKNSRAFDLSTDNSTTTYCPNTRDTIDTFISCLGRTNYELIEDTFVLATDFNQVDENRTKIVGHFNNQPFHAPPLAINLITNSLFKYYTNSSENTINVMNHPLPRTTKDEITDVQLRDVTGFNVASGISFGFSFLIASFVIFLIKENTSNSKHIQYMSGCNSFTFWISAFLWDMVNFCIPLVLVIFLLTIFGITEYVGGIRWLLVGGLLFLYGLSHIPQMYLLSYLFTVSATGFASLTAWNIISSQATLTPVQILSLPQLNLIDVAQILEWIFLLIFPNFSIGQSLADMYNNFKITEICKEVEEICPYFPNPCCLHYNTTNPNKCGVGNSCLFWTENLLSWQRPGLMRFFVFMPVQFLIQISLVLIYEAGFFRRVFYRLSMLLRLNSQKPNEEQLRLEEEYGDIRKDDDVINEENRIANVVSSGDFRHPSSRELFIVDGLAKHYSGFMAVKGISFSMKPAECFGLLGVNGAGKTTTFKMITGDEFLTYGNAYLNRLSLKENIKWFQSQLGYCPQSDPLIDQMTVLETMRMFSALRGIRPSLIDLACRSLLALLDLNEHMYKMCYTLSGGNKRKLAVAISLIGSPSVVLLDEPTSGMDPKTRRTLWNCLNQIRNRGKSLILTTHNMDETEVLCTNIGIMVNGELKCLGSLQHLKSKYGKGYTLQAKVKLNEHETATAATNATTNTKAHEFIQFILENVPKSELKECRDGFVNIHIADTSTVLLSKLFSLIEDVKQTYSIEYYVVTQTNLEQIFLNFASRQIDPETRFVKRKSAYLCC